MKSDHILYPEDISEHEVSSYEFKKLDSTSNTSTNTSPQINKEDIENIQATESISPMIEPEEIEKISNFNTNMMSKIEELSSKFARSTTKYTRKH